MSLERIVKHYKMTDLTGEEIENIIGKPPILYSDLAKYKSLEQVVGKEKYAIILYQTSSYSEGHYVAITQGDNGVFRYCDSYGIDVLHELQYTPYDQQLPKYLVHLFEKVGNYEVNRTDFQGKRSGISTCGRWSSLFCKFRNLPLLRITELFKTNNDAFLRDNDNCATILTLLALNDITSYLDAIPRGRGL
jgi:hypothetical protein